MQTPMEILSKPPLFPLNERDDLDIEQVYINQTALFTAVRLGQMSVLHIFVRRGLAPLQMRDENGNTVLDVAVQHGQIEVIEFLLSKTTIDRNATNNCTAVLPLAEQADDTVFSLLDKSDNDLGWLTTISLEASRTFFRRLIGLLVRDASPTTAIAVPAELSIYAKHCGREIEINNILFNKAKSIADFTAFDLAVFYNQKRIVDYIWEKSPAFSLEKLERNLLVAKTFSHGKIVSLLEGYIAKTRSLGQVQGYTDNSVPLDAISGSVSNKGFFSTGLANQQPITALSSPKHFT